TVNMLLSYVAAVGSLLSISASQLIPGAVGNPPVRTLGSGPTRIYWSSFADQKPTSAANGEANNKLLSPWAGFGIGYLERSPVRTPDRNLYITALQVMENIYTTRHDDFSNVITNYAWTGLGISPSPLNISATGRGLDAGTPFAFNGRALVLFVRWLGQIDKQPRAWEKFRCFFIAEEQGILKEHEVAVGNFTPFYGYGTDLPGATA
ncbi:MAG: hypothetical protein Q9219_007661, partial [cf. Caloplaca sp. 3 TL-2023]